jgi:hypothetical protein
LGNSDSDNYDYSSAGVGGNRFATILLYLSDLDENAGGETVFKNSWPEGTKEEDKVPLERAIEELRQSEAGSLLKQGSWEEELTAYCRTRLAVKPKKARAVLFYSQYPNGAQDHMAHHGACPVLQGTKWAANLWVWSAPMSDYEFAPRLWQEEESRQLSATFRNTGKNPKFDEAKLWYDDEMFFGDLGPNDPPIVVNTFAGHKWCVKVGVPIVRTLFIADEESQEFEI